MHLGEALRFSYQSLLSNKIRTFLTALGLVIGNASVVWVATISLTSQEFVLDQIRGIGSNMVYAQYEAGGNTTAKVESDFIKLSDVEAVRQQLGGRIIAATGVMTNYDRILINGREEDIAVIGTDEYYASVRNILVIAGRFMDASDVTLRQKVCMLTERLAVRLYGSPTAAVGQMLKIHGLQFETIGVFKERTETFGLSELSSETVVIPISVLAYFNPVERIDPLYVQARSPEDVEPLTKAVRNIVEARHRAGARYKVDNLNAILAAAKNIGLILSVVLVLVSTIALIISGIGIMNIMLVTVTERTKEIGLRMALGASRKEVLMQFLIEAMLISVAGGTAGILLGVAAPLSVRLFVPEIALPVSLQSILVAFFVSLFLGLLFGILPANRASRLNPTEALRYE